MWKLEIDSIAGIREGEATIDKGTNVVQASNFQGKSSFLKAIQTVVGTTGMDGKSHPLTEGEGEGDVVLDTPEATYKTTLKYNEETKSVSRSGDTYLTEEIDRTCAHLFAFLGEDNPIRAAVRNQDFKKLAELLQRPLDLEEIEARVNALKEQRRQIESQIEKSESASKQLPKLQEEVTQLEKKIENLEEEVEEYEDKVDEDSDQEDLRNRLTEKRNALQTAESRRDQLQDRIETKEERLEEKTAELESAEVPSGPEINADLSEKQDRIDELGLQIDLLKSLHRANREVIEENELELVSEVERNIDEDTITCWLSGDETTVSNIKDHLDKLHEKRKLLEEEQSELKAEVTKIQKEKRQIEKKRREVDRLEEEVKQLKVDIEDDKQELEENKNQIETLSEEAEELEEEFEKVEQETSKKLADARTELGRKESNLERVKSDLEEKEETASKLDGLKEEKAELTSEIETLRNRQAEKQEELEEEFNDSMGKLIETFAPGFGGAHVTLKGGEENGPFDEFEINPARDGRPTTIDNLSEAEVELIGIVTALAGYRTFDVNERVPLILVDGIGQLASEHIHNLTDFLSDTSEMFVTTAYPETGEFDGATISPSDWDVVSDEEPVTA